MHENGMNTSVSVMSGKQPDNVGEDECLKRYSASLRSFLS